MSQVTGDMWSKGNIFSKFQLSSSNSLGVKMLLTFGGKGSVSDKGVCSTALATLGLLLRR